MAIECEYCLGENFETQNGATFCLTCGAESQEHGQETIVDEETIGAFSDGQSSGLSSKSLQKKKKKRHARYRDKQKVPFNNIQVYTYILRGWINDTINELNMAPYEKELNAITLALWSKYLSKCQLAFVPKKKPRKIFNSFRDLQMAIITDRRRILTPSRIAGYKRKLAKGGLPSSRAMNESEYSGDSQEAKKKRRKAKRSFLDSVSVTLSEDTEDSSSYYTDITDEDSDSDTVDKSDEDHEDMEQVHLRILSKIQAQAKTKARRCCVISAKEPQLNLQVVFILFTLAMMLVKNSRVRK